MIVVVLLRWTKLDNKREFFALASGEFREIFAGKNGGPAHTAAVDYFFNTTAPGAGDVVQHALTVNAVGSGVVTKAPDKASNLCGEVATLTVVADPG